MHLFYSSGQNSGNSPEFHTGSTITCPFYSLRLTPHQDNICLGRDLLGHVGPFSCHHEQSHHMSPFINWSHCILGVWTVFVPGTSPGKLEWNLIVWCPAGIYSQLVCTPLFLCQHCPPVQIGFFPWVFAYLVYPGAEVQLFPAFLWSGQQSSS